MSKVTQIKDYLNAVVLAALPSYFQLPDNLATEDNTNTFLEKGFAISYGPAVNDTSNWCQGELLVTRDYDIRLTNNYVPNYDEEYRDDLESDLMEAIYTLFISLQADVYLGGLAFDSFPAGDTGIQYLVDESEKQEITTAINFQVRYRETF